MDKDTFNTIRRALHPDSRQSISDKKLGEAFDTFMASEKYVLNEKDSPTMRTATAARYQETWRSGRRAAAKNAKRTSGRSAVRPR